MDKIIIKDLLVRGIIGINDWERKNKQDILVNLEIEYDISKPGKSDKIEDTLNYRTLTKEIINYIHSSDHYLVESLAEKIATMAKEHGANKVKVRVEKPMALRFAKSVGVEIIR